MMRYLIICIAVMMLAALRSSAQGAHIMAGVVDTTVYTVDITDEDLMSMTHWSPDNLTHPPLPPGEALRVAREALQNDDFARRIRWSTEGIMLEPCNSMLLSGPWIYVVRFSGNDVASEVTRSPTMKVFVTVDGKLLQAQKAVWEQEAIKRLLE